MEDSGISRQNRPNFLSKYPEFFKKNIQFLWVNCPKCPKDGSIFCKRLPEFIQKIYKRNILNNLSKISGNFPEELDNIFENFGQFRKEIGPIFRGIPGVFRSEVTEKLSLMFFSVPTKIMFGLDR